MQVPRLKDCRYAPKNVGILEHFSKYVANMGQWPEGCAGCEVTLAVSYTHLTLPTKA